MNEWNVYLQDAAILVGIIGAPVGAIWRILAWYHKKNEQRLQHLENTAQELKIKVDELWEYWTRYIERRQRIDP